MKLTICAKASCSRVAEPGKRYCTKHCDLENVKRTTPIRKKSNAWHYLYNSYRWRKISRDFLRNNPICMRCGQPAKIADHIEPHRGNEELFYNSDNLQPLCWKCHSRKTLEENNYFKNF